MPELLIIGISVLGIAGLTILILRILLKRSVLVGIIVFIQLNALFMFFSGYLIGNGSDTQNKLLMVIPLYLAGFGLSILLLSNIIAKPLKLIGTVLKSVAEGSGDLTKKIEYEKRNEFGSLASYFNSFISSLNCMVTSVKRLTGENLGVSNRLAETSETFSESLNQVSTNAEGIKNRTEGLDSSINGANTTILSFREFRRVLAEKITDQATEITESSSAIEEMTVSIGNVSRTLRTKLNFSE